MEQYPVPQFIEREARIAVFLSFKQFIYLVAAGGVCILLYFILPLFLFLLAAIPIVGAAAALAFVKVQGMPLATVLLNSLGFLRGAKNYVWKKKETRYPYKVVKRVELKRIEEEKPVLKVAESRLKKIRTKIEMKTK